MENLEWKEGFAALQLCSLRERWQEQGWVGVVTRVGRVTYVQKNSEAQGQDLGPEQRRVWNSRDGSCLLKSEKV